LWSGGANVFHRLLKVTVLAIQGINVELGFAIDPDVRSCKGKRI
jgi:hypothetical protein